MPTTSAMELLTVMIFAALRGMMTKLASDMPRTEITELMQNSRATRIDGWKSRAKKRVITKPAPIKLATASKATTEVTAAARPSDKRQVLFSRRTAFATNGMAA